MLTWIVVSLILLAGILYRISTGAGRARNPRQGRRQVIQIQNVRAYAGQAWGWIRIGWDWLVIHWRMSAWLPISVCYLMILTLLWFLYPETVWKRLMESPGLTLLVHLFYVVAVSLVITGTSVWRTRMGQIAMLFAVITLTTVVLNWTPWLGEKYWIDKIEKEQEIAELAQYPFPSEQLGNEDAETLYAILMDSIEDKERALTVFRTCWLESRSNGFRHLGKDGKPVRGKREDNSENGAIGICQIKPASYGKQAEALTQQTGLDHSLETVPGQSRMAAWIANNKTDMSKEWALWNDAKVDVASGSLLTRGSEAPRPTVQSTPAPQPTTVQPVAVTRVEPVCSEATTEVPLEWGEWVDVGKTRGSYLAIDGPIWLEDGMGRKLPLDNHNHYSLEWADKVRFQARSKSWDGRPEPTPTVAIVTVCR